MGSQALVVGQFDNRQIEIMRRTVATGISQDEFLFFLEVCKHRGLNPFNREIYAFPGQGNKMTIQVSIDGLRLLAERSGKYKGQIGPMYCAEDGVWKEEWLAKTPPVAAKVGVIRADFEKPIWAVARFESYVKNTPIWQKMPDLMLAKCAESLALRRAFPAEMGGLYSHEEMEQAGNVPTGNVVVSTVSPNSERLEALYRKYENQGPWASRNGMLAFMTAVLGVNVTRDTIYELTDDLLTMVEQAAEEEAASEKAAVGK